jgi:DNA primase
VFFYLMKQHDISFKDALQRAASMAGVTGGAAATLYRPGPGQGRTGAGPAIRLNEPPADDWQERAVLAMVDCGANLFSERGKRARQWLNRERGLTDETLRRWWVGYSPGGTLHGHKFERGIVIANLHEQANTLWGLKIRRPANENKYTHVAGGKSRAMLWGADNLAGFDVAVVCEGEFDAMLLWQHAGDLCAVVAQGAATNVSIGDWLPYLLHVRRLYIAADADAAGDKAWLKWEKATKRVRRALPPLEQPWPKGPGQVLDITDAWHAGADLRAWVCGLLGIAEPPRERQLDDRPRQ